MAVLSLLDAETLIGSVRMTSVSNETHLAVKHEALDATTYGSGGAHVYVAGLQDVMTSCAGFYDAAAAEAGALAPDAEQFSQLGGAQVPVTICPTGADLSVAYIVGGRKGAVTLFGQVGRLAPFTAETWGDGKVARGQLIHPANVTRTAGGTGSTSILGVVPTGKSLYVACHAVTVTGTTPALTLTVQRDDNAGFTTPIAVATLGPVSAPASSLTIVPGPITPDDRYRLVWTLTGTTPVARFAVAVGVG
jgi:hypothetical protein